MSLKSDNPSYFFFYSAGLIKKQKTTSHLFHLTYCGSAPHSSSPYCDFLCAVIPSHGLLPAEFNCRPDKTKEHISPKVHSKGRPWWDGHCRCAGKIRGCFDKTCVCSLLLVLRGEDQIFVALHYLRVLMSSSHQNSPQILGCVCARTCVCVRTCMCVCVCARARACVEQHCRMIEMFKRTLPSELFVGLVFH